MQLMETEYLNYRCTAALERFERRLGVNREESERLFQEMLKWLFLTVHKPDGVEVNIYTPVMILDEMWHDFILCTEEYHNFCHKWFRSFIHHYPSSNSDKKEWQAIKESEPAQAERVMKDKLQMLISATVDYFDAETATFWFRTLPLKYSSAVIAKRQISELQKYIPKANLESVAK